MGEWIHIHSALLLFTLGFRAQDSGFGVQGLGFPWLNSTSELKGEGTLKHFACIVDCQGLSSNPKDG